MDLSKLVFIAAIVLAISTSIAIKTSAEETIRFAVATFIFFLMLLYLFSKEK